MTHDPNTFGDELRSALGDEPDFDYSALVSGTRARATRMRRRRAVGQAVTVAVLAPTLVGSAWFIGNRLTGDAGPQDIAVATQTTETDVAVETEAGPTTGEAVTEATSTTGEAVTLPPFQTSEPPAPLKTEEDAGLANQIEIPDPRPVGIPFLDDFGAPQVETSVPGTLPVPGWTTAEEGATGLRPHSAVSWGYFDPTQAFDQPAAEITLTAWDDAPAAMASLTGDRSAYPYRTAEDMAPLAQPWPGAEDADHLLVVSAYVEAPATAAVIRQGEYLVAVTVRGVGEDVPGELARTIAEQTAANLAVLDPEHGQDRP